VLQGDYAEKYVKLLTVTYIKAVKYILLLLFDSPSYKEIYHPQIALTTLAKLCVKALYAFG